MATVNQAYFQEGKIINGSPEGVELGEKGNTIYDIENDSVYESLGGTNWKLIEKNQVPLIDRAIENVSDLNQLVTDLQVGENIFIAERQASFNVRRNTKPRYLEMRKDYSGTDYTKSDTIDIDEKPFSFVAGDEITISIRYPSVFNTVTSNTGNIISGRFNQDGAFKGMGFRNNNGTLSMANYSDSFAASGAVDDTELPLITSDLPYDTWITATWVCTQDITLSSSFEFQLNSVITPISSGYDLRSTTIKGQTIDFTNVVGTTITDDAGDTYTFVDTVGGLDPVIGDATPVGEPNYETLHVYEGDYYCELALNVIANTVTPFNYGGKEATKETDTSFDNSAVLNAVFNSRYAADLGGGRWYVSNPIFIDRSKNINGRGHAQPRVANTFGDYDSSTIFTDQPIDMLHLREAGINIKGLILDYYLLPDEDASQENFVTAITYWYKDILIQVGELDILIRAKESHLKNGKPDSGIVGLLYDGARLNPFASPINAGEIHFLDIKLTGQFLDKIVLASNKAIHSKLQTTVKTALTSANTFVVEMNDARPDIIGNTTNTYNWNYSTPLTVTEPTSGQATQADDDPSIIKIHANDSGGGLRDDELNLIGENDMLNIGGVYHLVESVTLSNSVYTFVVTDTVQSTDGLLSIKLHNASQRVAIFRENRIDVEGRKLEEFSAAVDGELIILPSIDFSTNGVAAGAQMRLANYESNNTHNYDIYNAGSRNSVWLDESSGTSRVTGVNQSRAVYRETSLPRTHHYINTGSVTIDGYSHDTGKAPSGGSSQGAFTVSASLTTTPASGEISLDANQTVATKLYMHKTNNTGSDRSASIAALVIDDQIRMEDWYNQKYLSVNILGITDHITYVEFDIEPIYWKTFFSGSLNVLFGTQSSPLVMPHTTFFWNKGNLNTISGLTYNRHYPNQIIETRPISNNAVSKNSSGFEHFWQSTDPGSGSFIDMTDNILQNFQEHGGVLSVNWYQNDGSFNRSHSNEADGELGVTKITDGSLGEMLRADSMFKYVQQNTDAPELLFTDLFDLENDFVEIVLDFSTSNYEAIDLTSRGISFNITSDSRPRDVAMITIGDKEKIFREINRDDLWEDGRSFFDFVSGVNNARKLIFRIIGATNRGRLGINRLFAKTKYMDVKNFPYLTTQGSQEIFGPLTVIALKNSIPLPELGTDLSSPENGNLINNTLISLYRLYDRVPSNYMYLDTVENCLVAFNNADSVALISGTNSAGNVLSLTEDGGKSFFARMEITSPDSTNSFMSINSDKTYIVGNTYRFSFEARVGDISSVAKTQIDPGDSSLWVYPNNNLDWETFSVDMVAVSTSHILRFYPKSYDIPFDVRNVISLDLGAGAAPLTGTVLELSDKGTKYYNMATPSAATTYTVVNQVTGGSAITKINTTSQPTVTGGTLLASSPAWVTGTDMKMMVTYDGSTLEYYFIEL